MDAVSTFKRPLEGTGGSSPSPTGEPLTLTAPEAASTLKVRRRFFDIGRRLQQQKKNRARKRGRYQSILPVEPVVVHARTLGEVQWICPRCGCMNLKKPGWKTGRLKCRVCEKPFAIGVMFWKESRLLPPFNAILAEQPGLKVLNRKEPPKGQILIARFGGSVQWECTECKTWHGSGTYPDWQTGSVDCATCGRRWFLAPIFYPPRVGLKAEVPKDWIPPRAEYVEHWVEQETKGHPEALKRISERYRKSRRGLRDAGQAQATGAWFDGAFTGGGAGRRDEC